jgi:hypothetical protein
VYALIAPAPYETGTGIVQATAQSTAPMYETDLAFGIAQGSLLPANRQLLTPQASPWVIGGFGFEARLYIVAPFGGAGTIVAIETAQDPSGASWQNNGAASLPLSNATINSQGQLRITYTGQPPNITVQRLLNS